MSRLSPLVRPLVLVGLVLAAQVLPTRTTLAQGSIVGWGNLAFHALPPLAQVSSAGFHSMGLGVVGSIVVWGKNDVWQCEVLVPNIGITAVSANGVRSLVIQGYANSVCSLEHLAPEALTCLGEGCDPNPFEAEVPINNTGAEVLHNLSAVIHPGNGLEGGVPYEMTELAPGESATSVFPVVALPGDCDEERDYTVTISADNLEEQAISDQVFVPCCVCLGAGDQPVSFGLGQAYPNPFNPVTTLPFALDTTGSAELVVFSLEGAKVAVLHSGQTERGTDEATFDANALPSGVYLARLGANGQVDTRKLVLVK